MSFIKKMNKNTILVGVALIGIVITGVLIFANSSDSFSLSNIFGPARVSSQEIADAAIKYINDNQLSQTPASLVSVSDESGLVKMKVKIGTSEFDSYATKDGKLLFPQAFVLSPSDDATADAQGSDNSNTAQDNNPKTPTDIVKTDKPMLEAYVVSRCPFGLQMQRIMADVIQSVPSLADYMKVRYMGSVASSGTTITAMHGAAEAAENLRQICIREEQPAKYWDYVACQMKAGGTEISCEKSTGVDSAKLSSCISDAGRGVAYAKEDFDLNSQYGITGSPTLILGGSKVSEFDFGGRTSNAIKSVVCAAFNSQPDFCSTQLNTASAATSFSPVYSSSTAAVGNSGPTGANCAPAQ